MRVYDVSEPANPVLLSTTDAHWHNVIALGLWYRRVPVTGPGSASVASVSSGSVHLEPWILSASLDGTVRRWKLEGRFSHLWNMSRRLISCLLTDLVNPPKEVPKAPKPKEDKPTTQLTAEEEAELAELMEED